MIFLSTDAASISISVWKLVLGIPLACTAANTIDFAFVDVFIVRFNPLSSVTVYSSEKHSLSLYLKSHKNFNYF